MNTQQFGTFIADRRKTKGYTQKELADRLGVTDKAISRWENGHGYPDISSIEPLAKELEVTVLELMHGKLNEDSNIASQDADEAISNTIEITMSNRKLERTKIIILFIVSIVLLAGGSIFKNIPIYGIVAFVIMLIYSFAGVGLLMHALMAKKKNSAVNVMLLYPILLILSALGMLLILLCSSVIVVR